MRKSTAAVLAIGSAFALTAAAATAISVTGPFDPAAGSAPATTCDIGDTTIDSLTDGTNLLGFTLTTTNDTTSDIGCGAANIWLRVAYHDIYGSTYYFYASLVAAGDYTNGTDLYLTDGDTHSPGDFFTDIDFSTDMHIIGLADETIVDTTVLVMTGTPSNFARVTCFNGVPNYDDIELVGPLDNLDNLAFFTSLDGSCSGGAQPYSTFSWIVEADNADLADDKCNVRNSVLDELTPHMVDYWPSVPATWYMCVKL